LVFTRAEAASYLKHLTFRWQRVFWRKPQDFYLQKFSCPNFDWQVFRDHRSQAARCPVCGFAMVRVYLDNGWTLDLCSAMPALQLANPLFARWQAGLAAELAPAPSEKLPTSCV
jgi:hypothetical protein